MKGSMRAATALGVGYLLGRRRRLRTATLLAAATAFGSSSVGSMVLRRGLKVLGSTEAVGKLAPQVGEIADIVRGDLLTAGKAAATTAVSNQVDSLIDTLHERAERLRDPGAAAEEAGEAAGAAGRATSAGGKRAASAAGGAARRVTGHGRTAARDEDEYEDGDVAGGEAEDYDSREPDDEARRLEDERDDYDSGEDDYDAGEGDDGQRGGRAAAPRRSPVRRARR